MISSKRSEAIRTAQRKLAQKYIDDRRAYTDGKNEFIQSVISKAKKR